MQIILTEQYGSATTLNPIQECPPVRHSHRIEPAIRYRTAQIQRRCGHEETAYCAADREENLLDLFTSPEPPPCLECAATNVEKLPEELEPMPVFPRIYRFGPPLNTRDAWRPQA